MRTIPTVAYEAMFLFPQSALAELKATVEHVKELLTKNGAEIIALKKWADRPLAYPINKQKRGVYILCYFKAPTDKLGAIERAFNLSEQLVRQLIVRVDHLSEDEMRASEAQADLLIEANLRAASQPTPNPTPGPAAAAPVGAGRDFE
jgi:small subunit ribosomal protein S6